jgi:hypothetical protein
LGATAAQRARSRYAWPKVVAALEAQWAASLAQPFSRGSARSHPLRLDYEAQFGHFFTSRIDQQRRLVLVPERLEQVIYPELSSLVSRADLAAVATWLGAGVTTWAELVQFLSGRLADRQPWVGSFIASWLVKHGVLADASR